MKSERTEDTALKGALSAWRADVEMPPGFRASVWRRIRQRQESREGRWLWFGQAVDWLLRDIRLAAALPVAALAAGFAFGLWHDRGSAWDDRGQFQIAYVDSMDPYVLAARHLEGP